ncbi:MAG: sulfite exporter TauE/SafE family protein [Bacteroidetes bacterium]|nr:sulfite exporter TauE/SafE family protein [Bacteroidota bacterium]
MSDELLITLPLIFIVAFLYSSVGHGGASGYLALMALMGINSVYLRSSALLLNLFVAGIAFIQFYRNGFFRLKLLLPFAIASIPAAYAGSLLTADDNLYRKIIAIFLLAAALRIYGIFDRKLPTESERTIPVILSLFIGGFIGFLSGLMGIGGGILLSPFLILFLKTDIRSASACSAAFILVNSIAALSGLFFTGIELFHPSITGWVIAAAAGGLLGSWAGSRKFKTSLIKKTLSVILVLAGGKLFFT